MHRKLSEGSAAPLALLFTLVSMSFTVAYLQNSFSQSAMEKYRYAAVSYTHLTLPTILRV